MKKIILTFFTISNFFLPGLCLPNISEAQDIGIIAYEEHAGFDFSTRKIFANSSYYGNIVFTNEGNLPLVVNFNDIQIEGDIDNEFSITNASNAERQRLDYYFNARKEGIKVITLSIPSNDPLKQVINIKMTFEVIERELLKYKLENVKLTYKGAHVVIEGSAVIKNEGFRLKRNAILSVGLYDTQIAGRECIAQYTDSSNYTTTLAKIKLPALKKNQRIKVQFMSKELLIEKNNITSGDQVVIQMSDNVRSRHGSIDYKKALQKSGNHENCPFNSEV